MSKDHDVLDFQDLLRKKQLESMDAIYSLFESFEMTVKQINIRERVRAKHIFCTLATISHDTLLTKKWDSVFINWLSFDYQNIYGRSLFQEYFMKNSAKLDEPSMILGGLMMATVMEPIIIKEVKGGDEVIYCSFLEKGEGILRSKEQLFSSLQKNDIIFVRKITLLNQSIILGSFFQVTTNLKRLQEDFDEYQSANKALTWRSFLKRNVVKYLNSGHA